MFFAELVSAFQQVKAVSVRRESAGSKSRVGNKLPTLQLDSSLGLRCKLICAWAESAHPKSEKEIKKASQLRGFLVFELS